MRVILDECLPQRLRRALPGHYVTTIRKVGLTGYANGRLLRRLEGDFAALITMDGSLPAQQPIISFNIGVIVLKARSNRIEDVEPLAPNILEALAALEPGQLVVIS